MEDHDNTQSGDFPEFWNFAEHGRRVAGGYLEATEIPTENGLKPALVLDVDGTPRTVPCWHESLRLRIADELARRQPDGLKPGETIEITQGEKRPSQNPGRTVVPYAVRFPDAPQRSDVDIFVSPSSEGPTRYDDAEDNPDAGDVPY